MRGRGYSYSPSPPRSYRGRGRSPSPRGCYGGRGRSPSPRGYGGRNRDLSTSLLVRNLRHDCRPEDLRKHFFQFGPLKDIYLPRDFRTGEPRGFGFIQYVDPADAAEAKYQMDGRILFGRELTVVYAEENRKKPAEMRARERVSRGRTYGNRRSPRFSRSPRYSRSRSPPRRHSSRRSRSPHYARSRSRSLSYHSSSPKRLQHSQSASPEDRRNRRERSYSLSPSPDAPGSSRSPIEDDDYDARKDSRRERSRSRSQ